MLRVNFCHEEFHSTMVTLPFSEPSTRRSRSAFFSSESCSLVQPIHDCVDSINDERPRRMKCAPAFGLACATPMTDAAVTPEPPPETSQVSSLVKDLVSSTRFSANATRAHRRPSRSKPISTSPPSSNRSCSICFAASTSSKRISG